MFTFYDDMIDGLLPYRSAMVVLHPLIEERQITSIVDFGCGPGSWLAAAERIGVTDLVGVDGPAGGSPGVFVEHDLTRPLDLGRRFDLAICTEVGEHLPAEAAPTLIDTIVRHADVIVFSAAIPGQGGEGHINEQPYEYWDVPFMELGYSRHAATTNSHIAPWYRANLRVYVKEA